jgi:hypothetical protein
MAIQKGLLPAVLVLRRMRYASIAAMVPAHSDSRVALLSEDGNACARI